MHSILVAGHLCLDITPRLGKDASLEPGRLVEVGPLAFSLGGSVANTGGALLDLGAAVTPFARIGDDELGELLMAQLHSRGFVSRQLQVSGELATSYSLVIEPPGIDRTFWHHTGANDEFDGTSVELAGHDLLHLGYPPLLPRMLVNGGRPLHALLARSRAAGITTSLDLAVVDANSAVGALDWSAILASAFSECDIASPSLDDLTSALRLDETYSPELVGELADRMLDQGVAVAAISAGRHGLHLRTGSADRLRQGGTILAPLAESWANQAITIPPFRVSTPVTTNGAGDASTAGLLFALSRGANPMVATALAAAASAVVICGGRPTGAAVAAIDPSLASLFSV